MAHRQATKSYFDTCSRTHLVRAFKISRCHEKRDVEIIKQSAEVAIADSEASTMVKETSLENFLDSAEV